MNQLVAGPTVVHSHNILLLKDSKSFRGQPGVNLWALAPVTPNPVLCIYNGEYVLPEDMDFIPYSHDHIAYVVLPKGGDDGASSVIIGLILIVVGVYTGQYQLAVQGAIMLVGGLLTESVSDLTPNQLDAPSPTYTLNVSGNSARLGQAVPVPYGRHIIVPDYAAQPYAEWLNENDQYFHAIMCLGAASDIDVESIMIDDTDISHFSDVQTLVYGPDDVEVSHLVALNVINLVEVADNELFRGSYVGPFAICGPGSKAVLIAIDVSAPRGLYLADSLGYLSSLTMQWFVEVRTINDLNTPTSPWLLLGNESWTAATNQPLNRTYKYPLDTGFGANRYEVRLSRQDEKNTNSRAAHTLKWTGCRAVLEYAPPDTRCKYLEVKMRATAQLSGLSQRKFSVVLRRKLPTWNSVDGWTTPIVTSNPAWAIADILRNTTYGAKVPDNRVDVSTLAELAVIWDERKDEFNGVFDKRITAWAALNTVARAGRARPIMRGSVFTVVRDGPSDFPVAMFTMRNIKQGSLQLDYNLRTDDDPDAVEVEYFDEITWSPKTFIQPMPGIDIIDVSNPIRIGIPGVTRAPQAERESLYLAAAMSYRRSNITFTTEYEGFLPAFGDTIAISHDLPEWGINGDVEEYIEAENTIIVTEDIPWGDGSHYVLLNSSEGDVYGPYPVAPGAYNRSMLFQGDIAPELDIYDGTERERTRYIFGPGIKYENIAKITGIYPQNDTDIQLTCVVDDDRVSLADADVDDTGGTVGTGRRGAYAPDDVPVYDEASDEQHNKYVFYSTEFITVGSENDNGYVYAPD